MGNCEFELVATFSTEKSLLTNEYARQPKAIATKVNWPCAAGRATAIHAGTATDGVRVVTSGGRVLTVVGRGTTYRDAMSRAYAGVGRISYDGVAFRTDIGAKAL